MTRRDDERVQDIIGACARLAEIAARGRSAYDGDWVIRDAANYNLTVIGEALDNLSDEFDTGMGLGVVDCFCAQIGTTFAAEPRTASSAPMSSGSDVRTDTSSWIEAPCATAATTASTTSEVPVRPHR